MKWNKDHKYLVASSGCCNDDDIHVYYIHLPNSTNKEIVEFINEHKGYCLIATGFETINGFEPYTEEEL